MIEASLPPELRSSLPWTRYAQRSIALPADVSTPDGALQKCESDRGLLMRSTGETPLVEQARVLLLIEVLL